MITRRHCIVLSFALLSASGCGLQHVAGWLAAETAESATQAPAQPVAAAAAQKPASDVASDAVPIEAAPAAATPEAAPARAIPAATAVADASPAPPARKPADSAAGATAGARTPQPGIPVFAGNHERLRYGFKDGESYYYRIHIEAEMPDESKQIYDGNLTYTAKVGQPEKKAKPDDDRKPTATAFVVSPDGYLVTCHHVVDGAGKLEVAIDGKKYLAKVIEVDEPKDLAILKIDAAGLATVPLADSDKIEVGQEVRAIGFPLSSILGDTLKATRGTISGIETRIDRKLLHVDASINPGNSGGPLVNDQGEVVGVASAKLAGRTISNVGFGVPANDARRLLSKHKVTLASRPAGDRLDGPALVRAVSPAVALVTVLSGGSGSGDDRQITLAFSGSLTSFERPRPLRPGEFPRMPRFSPPRPPSFMNPFARGARVRNEVVIDSTGAILDASGGESLPFMLGNLAHFVIDPLSANGQKMWESERTCTIHEKPAEDHSFGPRIMRPRFGPFGPQFDEEEEAGTKYSASEITEYSLGEPSGDTVRITKEYELKTETEGREDPYLMLTGKGEITFDYKQGLPLEMTYKGTVSVNKQNVSVKIPLTVTYQYLDAAALAADKAEREARLAAAKAEQEARAAAAAPRFLTPEELTKAMEELKSDDIFTRKRALDKLAGALPDESVRAEVAAEIGPLVNHTDRTVRNAAIPAITTWGGPENIPVLIEQLQSRDPFTRMKVMEALGKLKDQRGVEALCERFKSLQDRHNASKALEELGAMAEKQVAELIGEGEWSVRMYACQLLGKIGTAESIPALEAAAEDSNGLVKNAAKSAIESINKRSKS